MSVAKTEHSRDRSEQSASSAHSVEAGAPAGAAIAAPETQRKRLNLVALRDPSRPVSRIADDLLPYLQVIVDEFHPVHLILFGSYAYGKPDRHSDVDLLVVKDIEHSSYKDALAILTAWSPIIDRGRSFSFDLHVESPERHAERLAKGGAFYTEINERGLSLLSNHED